MNMADKIRREVVDIFGSSATGMFTTRDIINNLSFTEEDYPNLSSNISAAMRQWHLKQMIIRGYSLEVIGDPRKNRRYKLVPRGNQPSKNGNTGLTVQVVSDVMDLTVHVVETREGSMLVRTESGKFYVMKELDW